MMHMMSKYCHDDGDVQNASSCGREVSVPQHEKREMVPELVDNDDDDDTCGCDACPYCQDVCLNPVCISCNRKMEVMKKKEWECKDTVYSPPFRLFEKDVGCDNFFTLCQVRRHNHSASAWLLCGDDIYDATKHIRAHPGGERSIIRKSGGVADCTIDMSFHSGRACKIWKQSRIGVLRPCPGQEGVSTESDDKGEQCVIS